MKGLAADSPVMRVREGDGDEGLRVRERREIPPDFSVLRV